MKHYIITKAGNDRWAGWTIRWWDYLGRMGDTNTFFWDRVAGQREVDRLNQAERSMAQAKETV